jgi:hypothetical protein
MMDKKTIKQHLRFISEAEGGKTPGISVTSSVHKKSGEENKKGVKAIEKDLASYDKSLKQDSEIKKTTPNKFNYNNDPEKEYHDQMEIMNGQEMIEYDREPNQEFKDRAKEAIEGSSRMGNKGGKDMGNAEATWGASSDDFGKNLVKNAANSFKKRLDAEKGIMSFGDDVEIVPKGSKPMAKHSALSENYQDALSMNDTSFPSELFAHQKDIKNMFIGDTSSDMGSKINRILKIIWDNIKNEKWDLPNVKMTDEFFDSLWKKLYWYFEEQQRYNALNENKNKTMKRLKFKKEFNGVGNALKMIPESYKVDEKIFEMTDGNETYKIRWEGTLNEGRAVILMASDKTLINEDMQKMKHLMGYKSQETLGLVKGKARLDENAMFSDIWGKTKTLLEGEDIEDSDAKEGDLDDAVSNAPEAKKHVHMGSASTDKGTKAPAPKTGSMESLDDVKKQAPEAKKHVHMGSASTDKGTQAPAPKTGNWEDINVPQAAEAKKHVHMGEGIEINGTIFEFINENILDEEDENEFGTNAVTGEPLPDPASQMVTEENEEGDEDNHDEE